MDSKRVYLGAQVLNLLGNLPFYRDVVSARFKLWEGWCLGRPLTMMIFDIMEEMWGLSQSDTVDQNIHALKLSKEMFQTHARPFKTPANMPWSDFKHALSGRWETVGLMFCITGLSTEWLSEDDPIFQRHGSTDPRSLATTASAVSDICLQFCDGAGIINDIVCWLLMHQTTLLATVYGDSDSRPWRKLGELTTTVFALGLHQDSSYQLPLYLAELRKRIMVATFTIDKILATFLGRPPLVSWRYCDIQFPLDLSFEEMLLDPSLVQEKILCLEENGGWNDEGTIRKGAWARISLFKSILREKILELSLSYRVEDIRRKVEDLLEENRKLRMSLPRFLQWSSEGDIDVTVPIVEERVVFSLHLDFLYNDFLLYRTIQKWTHAQPSAIIETSREMLNALLSMVARSSRLGHPVFDMGFNVRSDPLALTVFKQLTFPKLCYFGLPAAGILSAELLRRSRSIVSDDSILFPRSGIIQTLSIFSSHLDTFIQCYEGNYRISQAGQRVIRHILDQVLSYNGPPTASIIKPSEVLEQEFPVGDLLNEVDANDRDLFLDWMDGTVEHKSDSWLRWVNFN
ncbi:Transcription factor [Penicillium cosmopolitanum]|uniref:Transcription factor n=1 Tax=Penicillium cosmopolitanum TaxID=1131564 RepID=A0A9W9SHE4_9EURO|nr:Transcription factor [Penicillium cosmopolitanum]KAJ5378410.1 Transcription factor [Penicillium cosmopolitanum]